MDKISGVHPVRIREILHRIMGKYVFKCCKEDGTHVLGVDQLSSYLQGWIEGGIYAMS